MRTSRTLAILVGVFVPLAPLPAAGQTGIDCSVAVRELQTGETTVEKYRTAIELCPSNASLHYNLSILLAKEGQHEAALAAAEQASTLKPDARFSVAKAKALQELARPDEARAEYERALQLDSQNPQAMQGLVSLPDTGSTAPKRPIGIDEVHEPDVLYTLSVQKLGAGATAEAVRGFEKILATDPNSVRALIGLGVAHRKDGALDESEAAYRRAVGVDPASFEAQRGLGETLMARGKLAEAEPVYRKAVELNGSDYSALRDLGLAQTQLGKFGDAETTFRSLFEQDVKEPVLVNAFGWALLQNGRKSEAKTMLENGVKLAPGDAQMRNNLGVAQSALGQAAQAKASFEEALRLDPSLADAKKNLAALQPRTPHPRLTVGVGNRIR